MEGWIVNNIYSKDELFRNSGQKYYDQDAKEAAFLLGGIGTGTVSLGSRGELRDWEIFNRPGKGNYIPYSFFAIRAEEEGKDPVVKVIESELQPPHSRAHGYTSVELAGLPRFKSSRMKGEYPFVEVELFDDELNLDVSLEAFTPFIPLNADDSGIPGAIMRYKVKNNSNNKMKISIMGSLGNAVSFAGYNEYENPIYNPHTYNEYQEEGNLKGIFMTGTEDIDILMQGSMSIMTSDPLMTYKTSWLSGGWWDAIHDLWNDFCDDGKLEAESVNESLGSLMGDDHVKGGSIAIPKELEAGEEATFEFIISWYFPNRVKGWHLDTYKGKELKTIKNYYATLFENSWDAGFYLFNNMDRLEKASRDFRRALFSSTYPDYVIDALSSNITVIRSNTCFRIEDGTFLGWEGCHDQSGSCEGSCTHVWNYAQTLAFLFPELERSMRRVEFNLETDEKGSMAFRARQVFGLEKSDFLPATDGQMGTIIRLYREWKLSGDDDFLKEVWTNAKKALDFAFDYWDKDGDFVLESQQHNTYDIEFYGPSSLTNSMFYGALKAGSRISEYLGDEESSLRYRKALEKGSKKMDELLWNGEYYEQRIEDVDSYRYQYGKGCLSDQILGQSLAHVAGLGYILPEEHIKSAVHSIYKYNFLTSFKKHHNVQRTYALNDEKGLVLCSWPKGGRPKIPFVYSDEVWTGIEYQVATHLIYEGYIDEALTIVKALRERHDGYKRNPWNEVECGHHYARSMASWGLLVALSGFKYDLTENKIDFAPVINQDEFSTFWSTGKEWGIYRQSEDKETGKLKKETKVLYSIDNNE